MVEVLEVSKNRSGRVTIVLEGEQKYTLLYSAYRERPLKAGDAVDPEEFDHWVALKQYRSALEKAVSMLSRRACSTFEIKQKLKETGYSDYTTEMVILKLQKNSLINDQDFAGQWARFRSNRQYGPRRIDLELRRKGISSHDAEAAISNLSEEEQLENAVRIAQKAMKNAKQDEAPQKTRNRILSAIVRRGYDWDIAREAMNQAMRENEPDSWD